jgi:hypothetical protein
MSNSNVFSSNMEFSTTKFDNFYKATNSISPCYLEQVACIGWVASYEDPKWKQTGLSYEDAVAEFGFKNVKAKPNGCVNGDWLIEVKDGFTSDEKEFDTPTQAIAWLETKIPFSMKLAEFI